VFAWWSHHHAGIVFLSCARWLLGHMGISTLQQVPKSMQKHWILFCVVASPFRLGFQISDSRMDNCQCIQTAKQSKSGDVGSILPFRPIRRAALYAKNPRTGDPRKMFNLNLQVEGARL
jgi:hypothetical protein